MMPHLAPPRNAQTEWPCLGSSQWSNPVSHTQHHQQVRRQAPGEELPTLLAKLEQGLCDRLEKIEKSIKRLAAQREEQRCPSGTIEPYLTHQSSGAFRMKRFEKNTTVSSLSLGKQSSLGAQETSCDALDAADGPSEVESQRSEDPAANMLLRPTWQLGSPVPGTQFRFKVAMPGAPHGAAPLDPEDLEECGDRPWFVLLPTSHFRCFWDMCMIAFIIHDMAVVPVSLGFNTGDNWMSRLIFWPSLLYWTLDMPMSFLTGFYRNGRIETRLAYIALKYFRTWFLLDVIIVITSWLWIDDSVSGYVLGRAGKSLRAFRIVHSFRILRLAKLRRLTEYFYDHVTSEFYHIVISMAKYILIIVWLNHFIACVWWFIGSSMGSAGSDSWTEKYEESQLAVKYFTSLHWSLTQFTPASMEVTPRNLPERIFSVLVLLFAMIAFSSFLSSITAAMTQLRTFNQADQTNFAILRRYLRNHKVHLDLTSRIMHCVTYRLQKVKREVQENQVHFLQFLSKPLRLELSNQLYSPILTKHPFFQCYSDVDPEAMRRVCLEATTQSSFCSTDLVFTEGSSCDHMYFVLSGQLWYSDRALPTKSLEGSDSRKLVRSTVNFMLEEGDWCCEFCIWYPWTHQGTLSAVRMSEVLAVDVVAFITISAAFPAVYSYAKQYAEIFSDEVDNHLRDGMPLTDMSTFSLDTLQSCVDRAFVRRAGMMAKQSSSGSKDKNKDLEAENKDYEVVDIEALPSGQATVATPPDTTSFVRDI